MRYERYEWADGSDPRHFVMISFPFFPFVFCTFGSGLPGLRGLRCVCLAWRLFEENLRGREVSGYIMINVIGNFMNEITLVTV